MKKIDIAEIENAISGLPDNLAGLIRESLDTHNPGKKLDARADLVRMGKSILPQTHRLLDSENALLRKEAAKIVELIADRRSIPVLINLLDDKEFEIRWIAAEGLIKIGRRSILPLLKSVRNGKSSFLCNKGAHHVLTSLLNESEQAEVKSLLLSLDDSNGLGSIAPIEASKAIKIL